MADHKNYYHNVVFSRLPNKPILIHPDLKIILGSLNAAIWFSQILYWYDKGSKEGCIYKSRFEIEVETGLSRDQQIRVEKHLKHLGIVYIKVRPGTPSPINHIYVNFTKIDELIGSNVRKIRTLKERNSAKLKSAFADNQFTQTTENISESTQKNTHNNKEPPNTDGSGYQLFQEAKAKLAERKSL